MEEEWEKILIIRGTLPAWKPEEADLEAKNVVSSRRWEWLSAGNKKARASVLQPQGTAFCQQLE